MLNPTETSWSTLCNEFIRYYASTQSNNLRKLINEKGFTLSPLLTAQANNKQREIFEGFFLDPCHSWPYEILLTQACNEDQFIEDFLYKKNLINKLFSIAADNKCPDIIHTLLTETNYRNYLDIKTLYNRAFYLVWNDSVQRVFWTRVRNQITTDCVDLFTYPDPSTFVIDLDAPFIDMVSECYQELFKNPMSPAKNKDDAIKIAIAQYYNLLHNNPQIAIKYLQFLNDEFARYYQETTHAAFPRIPSTAAYLIPVNDL